MKLSVARLGHVGIAVRDLPRSIEFYTSVLGLKLSEQFVYDEKKGHGVAVLAGAFVRSDTTHHCLSIFKLRDAVEPPAAHHIGLHHIAFEMRSSEDLLEMYHKFQTDDIPIVNARVGGPGNQPRFYGLDPDGNLLEFYWNIDQIGWDGIPRPYAPIQEVELETFDFEAYEVERERIAAEAQSIWGAGRSR